MATSGTHTFTLTRDELITLTFQFFNINDINTTPAADDISYANKILNLMLLYWSGQGIRLWKRKQAYLFPSIATESYTLSGANCTNTYVSTTISADEALGQTLLSVTSSTGMTAGDYVGIELDDGTRQWTTISTVNSSTTITVGDALTDAASSSNTVVSYTTKIPKPIRIIRGTTRDLKNGNIETMMQPISFDEYFNQPDKETPGTPNNFHYDKYQSTGTLYLFPSPDDVSKIVTFTYLEPIEETGESTDEIDIPREWYLPVVYCLGVELGYAYGDFPALDKIEPRAREFFEMVKMFDSDDESLRLGLRS